MQAQAKTLLPEEQSLYDAVRRGVEFCALFRLSRHKSTPPMSSFRLYTSRCRRFAYISVKATRLAFIVRSSDWVASLARQNNPWHGQAR